MKKSFAILFALVLTLALAAPAPAAPEPALPDAGALFESVSEAMLTVENYAFSFEMIVNFLGTFQHINATGIYFQDPCKAKITFPAATFDTTTEDVEGYFEHAGDLMMTYIKMYGTWYKEIGSLDSVQLLADYQKMIAMMEAIQDMWVEAPQELIQERAAYKLTLLLDVHTMIAQDETALGRFSDLLSTAGLSHVQDDPSMRLSIYVDADTSELLRMEIDMADFLMKIAEAMSLPYVPGELTEYRMIMDLWDINAAPDFEIPPEARNAQPVPR